MGHLALCFVTLFCSQSIAGEIPGLPASLPPTIERNLEMVLANDFFGSGGSVDNFRTQQISLVAKPAERWSLVFDHSVLTLYQLTDPGRTDQLSFSVGYDLLKKHAAGHVGRLTAGTGFRSTGDFAGERVQNGFHRLINNTVIILPYTDTRRTDATAWMDAEYSLCLRQVCGAKGSDDWRLGAWWRANSLLTSDSQWDASAAMYAVASKRALDIWLGLRQDWRNGYNDPVLRETAAAEQDLAVVAGIRFGALVVETVQQLNNQASYGQVRLVSSGENRGSSSGKMPRIGLEVGFLVPDVQLHFAARTPTSLLTAAGSSWRESAYVSIDYGEPQHRDNTSVFIESAQLGVGLEWEQRLLERSRWLSAYGSAGIGWRNESLIGDGALIGDTTLTGVKSASVGRAALLAGVGLRMDASPLGSRWNLRIQLGISGWLPASDAEVQFGDMSMRVQQPGLNVLLGMTFDYE